MRKFAVKCVIRLLMLRCEGFVDVWFWELTPMPVGLPTNGQLFQGFLISFLPVAYLNHCLKKADEEMMSALRQTK